MKRTQPLQRTSGLRRTRLSNRPTKRLRYRDAAAMDAFKAEHLSCGCCWKPTWNVWLGLSTHHILNGKFCRKDHPANVIMLCRECHDRLDTGCVGIVLTLKMEDTATWDREWLEEWAKRFKRILPQSEPLSDWITEARSRWSER